MDSRIQISKRWLIALVAVAVAALVAVGALAAMQFAGRGAGEPTGSASSPSASASSSPAPDTARIAQGCLGGQVLSAETVLTAQREAPLDDAGAAEFAATFFRWVGVTEDSVPPKAELDVVAEAVIDENATEAVEVMRTWSERDDVTDERQGPTASMADTGYYIESSSEDQVVVSILGRAPELDDDEKGTYAKSLTFTLSRATGVWTLKDWAVTREPQDLLRILTPFKNGC